MRLAMVLAIAACGGPRATATFGSLRAACAADHYWDGGACRPRGDGKHQVTAGKAALVEQDVEAARAALDAAAARGGPLDHATNVLLWEQRGIAAAYLEDQPTATAAFDMVLALDPGHFLSYTLAPKVTFVFEKVRKATQQAGPPAIDVNWPSGQRVGEPVPVELQVLADPKRFLDRATVFVRERGDTGWRAADVALAGKREARVVLPPLRTPRPTSLELYVRAYDDRHNEVLAWADPARPREIPLRYDPPAPWYRDWRTYAIGGTALAAITGAIVYAVTLAPPDRVGGSAGPLE